MVMNRKMDVINLISTPSIFLSVVMWGVYIDKQVTTLQLQLDTHEKWHQESLQRLEKTIDKLTDRLFSMPTQCPTLQENLAPRQ